MNIILWLELHGDGFGLQVLVQRFLSQIFSKTRLFEASEWSSYVCFLIVVHKDSTGLNAASNTKSQIGVFLKN